MHICAKKGDLESAKKLLEQGIDPNITDFAGKFIKLLFLETQFLNVFIANFQAGRHYTKQQIMDIIILLNFSSKTAQMSMPQDWMTLLHFTMQLVLAIRNLLKCLLTKALI